MRKRAALCLFCIVFIRPIFLIKRVWAGVVCGLLIVGCDGEEEQVAVAPARLKLEAKNELIPLRLKQMNRSDRLPAGAAAVPVLTSVATSGDSAVAEPGEQWADEKFAKISLGQLKRLVAAASEQELADVLAAEFRCSDLNPESEVVELGAGIRVQKGKGGEMAVSSPTELWRSLQELGELKVKVINVEGLKLLVHVEGNRPGAEYSATWKCRWEGADSPRLLEIELVASEVVQVEGEWFADVTQSALKNSPRFDAQVMRGIEYWSQRITRIGDMAMTGHHGIAVGDVNGDGLEDMYVCDGGSLPNQLYIQQADGSARELASQWGVAWLEDSRGALLVDLDGDGDQDLVVATIAMIAFAENNGAGKFELRGGFPGAPYPFSLSAADFDSDGDLDIYTCVYSAGDEELSGRRGFEAGSPTPFNDANNGGRNVLLANLGGFEFGDVTAQVGLEENNSRWSFAAAWEDWDRDGDPDLYVANDFGRNSFYRNDGGIFSDIAAEAGVEDMAAGMSVSWGDYDRDGSADLYVGNMFSAAGHRIGYQRKFAEGMQRMARGNSLFAGGAKGFEDVGVSAGVSLGRWAWSSAFADLNNDGWQDLVVANGYLTNTRDDDL